MISGGGLPPAIERGLFGLRALAPCSMTSSPTFDEQAKVWVVRLTLRREIGARFIARATQWCVLLDPTYPFGRISVHPASQGGMTATFPHQARNEPGRDPQGWRTGRLCLDGPFHERRGVDARDPVGDPEQRLRWHVERALEWIQRAGNNALLVQGDPFELPDRPRSSLNWARSIVHDEGAESLSAWHGRAGSFGRARFGVVTDIRNVLAVKTFEDLRGDVVRAWSGRRLADLAPLQHVDGFWWLWPGPIVRQPWQAPGNWRELRRIAKCMNVDVDGMLRWLFPQVRGSQNHGILLLGYPIPMRIGDDVSEVHWDALLLPRLEKAVGQPRGFRANTRGWWHRDRYINFASDVALEYRSTENWNGARLQARGRLPNSVRDCRIAILGVGALGSILAEMLVRAGVERMALIDGDELQPGNVTRHIATLVDVGEPKVTVVARRLRQVSPAVRIVEFSGMLAGCVEAIETQLDEYDLVIDCTASDNVLSLLSRSWWSIPRTFTSFSMGVGGKRLFSFGVSGNRFPQEEFDRALQPWLKQESSTWAGRVELLEGAGCWSPLFPARCDDVLLAAATCLKELETLVSKRPTIPRFRVFTQSSSDDGFSGFSAENAQSDGGLVAS